MQSSWPLQQLTCYMAYVPGSLLNKLQRVQNACARLIFNEHNFCHRTPLVWSCTSYHLDLRLSLKFFWLLLRFFMVSLRLIYHLLFLLGVHRDIILGTQMTIFYLVNLVSYPKQHLAFTYATPKLWSALAFRCQMRQVCWCF